MRLAFVVLFAALPPLSAWGSVPVSAGSIQKQLDNITVDPAKSFHVRDLRLRRGDASIYLNEGVLAFAGPIAGHTVAAVFTTETSEGGDGEVILLPSQAAERASLSSFTGSPNLDEHFDVAVFLFSDLTADELMRQILDRGMPEQQPPAPAHMTQSLAFGVSQSTTALVRTLLDSHSAQEGVFFSTFVGRRLGTFQFNYQPGTEEPSTMGATTAAGFQIWTSFRPRAMPAFLPRQVRIEQYQIDGTIAEDLGLSATAHFRFTADASCGRTVALELSPRLRVSSATIDGRHAEFLQQPAPDAPGGNYDSSASVLLVNDDPLASGRDYQIEIQYSGSVITKVAGAYFVRERTSWYPHLEPLLTTFDITLRCPERFRLVMAGELVDESVAGHVRTVHRRTETPSQLAGFNLGQYQSTSSYARQYRVDTYAESGASIGMNGVPEQAASILTYYTQRWMPLPLRSLAITPVPGYFGQGFPGLVYLSSMSYLREQDRPASLRGERTDTFFSELLLPHEIAHQWWGNLVTSADYRSAWLMEAMANYAALEYLDRNDPAALNRTLAAYRGDLLQALNGKRLEQVGPVDFGIRILQNAGEHPWHTVVYGKGSWVLHMLRRRLGDTAFHQLEQRTLTTYSGKSITNEDFRAIAASLSSSGSDKSLAKFFDTWIYGSGIPSLSLKKSGDEWVVNVEEVDDGFTADLPLRCKLPGKSEETRLVAIVSGENAVSKKAGEVCQLPRETDFLYSSRP